MTRIKRWRSSALTMLRLSQGAWQECALLGQREIDLEHVFLASLDDADVARTLARHKVTREGTRQAVEGVVRDEVAALGIDLDGMSLTARRPVQDLHHDAVGDLAMTERAQAAVSESRSFAEAVIRVIDDPSAIGPRLIAAQGADPAAVRVDVAALAEAQGASPRSGVSRRAQGKAETGADGAHGAEATTLPNLHLAAALDPLIVASGSRHLAVPWEQAWSAVSRADGILPWLLLENAEATSPTEVSEQQGRGRRSATVTRRLVAAEPPRAEAPGHALWQEWGQRVGRDRVPTRWFHVTVTPEADGSAGRSAGTGIDLVIGMTTFGYLGPVVRPLVRLLAPIGVRNALYQLGLTLESASDGSGPTNLAL